MVFEALNNAAEKGELACFDFGMMRYHVRRDGQMTVLEIIVLPVYRCQGRGRWLLFREVIRRQPLSVVARCPADLDSNGFWQACGFTLDGTETAKSGRPINRWRLGISSASETTQRRRWLLAVAAGNSAPEATGALHESLAPSLSSTANGSGLIGIDT
jgi:hypothetical protein